MIPQRNPATHGIVVFGVLVAIGVVMIVVGWQTASSTTRVAFQTPALVSGGLAGLTLVLIGCGLLHVHLGRRLAASERVATDELIAEIQDAAAAAKQARS